MLNRLKKTLAFLICMSFLHMGAMAVADENEDSGAATGGSIYERERDRDRDDDRDRERDKDREKRDRKHRVSPSPSPTVTPTPTPSPTATPTPSPTPKPSPTPTPTPTATPTPTPKPSPTPTPATTSGATLYQTYCSGCHGTLSKKGWTASQIQSAISSNRGGMGFLSTLTSSQIQAIADAVK